MQQGGINAAAAAFSSALLSSLRVCLFLFLVVCLRVNSPQGAVASRQLMAGVGRDRGMRNACELERRGRTGGREGGGVVKGQR